MIDDTLIISQKVLHEKWTHSNGVCLMVTIYIMEKTIKKSIVDSPNVKMFMDSIVEKFVKFDKEDKEHYILLWRT